MAGVPKMTGVELTYRKWLARVNEKLLFILMSIKEKKEISEQDYELLRAMHRAWYLGWHPIYAHENPHVNTLEKVAEQGFFEMTESQSSADGTEIEGCSENDKN